MAVPAAVELTEVAVLIAATEPLATADENPCRTAGSAEVVDGADGEVDDGVDKAASDAERDSSLPPLPSTAAEDDDAGGAAVGTELGDGDESVGMYASMEAAKKPLKKKGANGNEKNRNYLLLPMLTYTTSLGPE